MEIGSLAEWVTAAVTVPTIVYALVQFRLARQDLDATTQATIAETRPYVWVQFVPRENDFGQAGVSLRIMNGGRTPAFDVILQFESGGDSAPWRESTVGSHFPFLRPESGIRILPPGSHRDYYVGRWSADSELLKVWDASGDTEVTVSYRSASGLTHRDTMRLALRDSNGTGELKDPRGIKRTGGRAK